VWDGQDGYTIAKPHAYDACGIGRNSDWYGLKVPVVEHCEYGTFSPGEGYTAMLVLSRKKNESIVINSDITITVVEIRGDKVRLGIVAPKDVAVHRQEVWEAIHGQPAPTPAVIVTPDASIRV